MDDSIEGLLQNLKKTLEVDGARPKEPQVEERDEKRPVQSPVENSSVFMLTKSFESIEGVGLDLVKKRVLSFLESEIKDFVQKFCSSEVGMEFIKGFIAKSLSDKESEIMNQVRENVNKKIEEALSK